MLNDNDSSFVRMHAIQTLQTIEAEMTRPSVLFRPRIFMDGNSWCALYGADLMEGVSGFGKSPSEAAIRFDVEWLKATERAAGAGYSRMVRL